jgi:hypothetical protein
LFKQCVGADESEHDQFSHRFCTASACPILHDVSFAILAGHKMAVLGTSAALLAADGRYAAMWWLQQREEKCEINQASASL